jgi:hypothetical protein
VRRFFPFFPAISGRAVRDLEWDDETITSGSLVLLDLYGTDHMDTVWERPRTFDPHRFTDSGQQEMFVAQGAGDPLSGRHCPGAPDSASDSTPASHPHRRPHPRPDRAAVVDGRTKADLFLHATTKNWDLRAH